VKHNRFLATHIGFVLGALLLGMGSTGALEVITFRADVTPPMGAPLCNGNVTPVAAVDDPLTARGIVLYAGGQTPVVLCVVDWVGIGNTAHDAWRQALADAAGTTVDRVTVHTVHQHDAPGCDFTVEELAARVALSGAMFDPDFARQAIARTAEALRTAATRRQHVTHVGFGKAKVERVASNRRIMGENGKVRVMRASRCKDPALRAEPEGLIDPYLRSVSFWDDHTPVAVLMYYATHPQTRYGEGHVSADMVGWARERREDAVGAPHLYFTGAGGNIAAGKYNDGSVENRTVLSARVEDGMRQAWDNTKRFQLSEDAVAWATRDVALPVREEIDDDEDRAVLRNQDAETKKRVRAARELAWRRQCAQGHRICIGRLRLGPLSIIHMPGELFVEYQLAAQQMAGEAPVCMAAYGDYGPGYIGTAEAYTQGGYETQLHTSRVSPKAEAVLLQAMRELLEPRAPQPAE